MAGNLWIKDQVLSECTKLVKTQSIKKLYENVYEKIRTMEYIKLGQISFNESCRLQRTKAVLHFKKIVHKNAFVFE